jgi:hypothetical protein
MTIASEGSDRFIFSLLVDPVRAELHVSDTQVSLLQGLAFVLIYAFAGPRHPWTVLS